MESRVFGQGTCAKHGTKWAVLNGTIGCPDCAWEQGHGKQAAYMPIIYKAWEFYGSNSNACYARVLKTVVDMRGRIMDTHRSGGVDFAENPYTSVVFLISLPEGKEEDFARITKTELHKQTIVGIN